MGEVKDKLLGRRKSLILLECFQASPCRRSGKGSMN
jgi:hypothetical protein